MTRLESLGISIESVKADLKREAESKGSAFDFTLAYEALAVIEHLEARREN